MAYDIKSIERACDSKDLLQSHPKHGWVIARWEQYPRPFLRMRDAWGVIIGRYHAVDWDGKGHG